MYVINNYSGISTTIKMNNYSETTDEEVEEFFSRPVGELIERALFNHFNNIDNYLMRVSIGKDTYDIRILITDLNGSHEERPEGTLLH
jgi:hypothetical protein